MCAFWKIGDFRGSKENCELQNLGDRVTSHLMSLRIPPRLQFPARLTTSKPGQILTKGYHYFPVQEITMHYKKSHYIILAKYQIKPISEHSRLPTPILPRKVISVKFSRSLANTTILKNLIKSCYCLTFIIYHKSRVRYSVQLILVAALQSLILFQTLSKVINKETPF